MDVAISVEHKGTGLNFILHVTAMDYSRGYPGSGPTYSCGGTPPEPAEAYPTEGYVEFDGKVEEIVNITAADMDVIMQLTNDNETLFDTLCDENAEDIEEMLLEYKESEMCEEMAERVDYARMRSTLDEY
jgi:hypothetical protein